MRPSSRAIARFPCFQGVHKSARSAADNRGRRSRYAIIASRDDLLQTIFCNHRLRPPRKTMQTRELARNYEVAAALNVAAP
jgi:hypothetical protein